MAFTLTGMTILAVVALVGLLLIATIVVANMDLHLTDLPSDPIEKKLKRGVITTNPVITSDELQNEQDENLEEIQANPLVIGAGISGILNMVDGQINQATNDGNNALDDSQEEADTGPDLKVVYRGNGNKDPDEDPDKKPGKKPDKDPNKDPDKDPNINPIKITAQIGAGLLVPTLIGNMLNVDTVGDDANNVISPFDTRYIVRVCDTGTGQIIIQYTDGTQRTFDKKDVPQNILAMAGQDVNDKGGTNSSKKEEANSSKKEGTDSGAKGEENSNIEVLGKKKLKELDISTFEIKNKHLASSTSKRAAKFNVDTAEEAASIVEEALNNGKVVEILDNGVGDAEQQSFSAIIETGKVIGTKGQTKIKIVYDENTTIWTVYPVN